MDQQYEELKANLAALETVVFLLAKRDPGAWREVQAGPLTWDQISVLVFVALRSICQTFLAEKISTAPTSITV